MTANVMLCHMCFISRVDIIFSKWKTSPLFLHVFRILFIVGFLFLSHIASITAQNKFMISGSVSDVDKQPIVMATVAIENTTKGTYTDNAGKYMLELPKGKYMLSISSIGFKTIKKEFYLASNQKLNFTLEENAVNLKTVEVYAKTKTQQIKEGAFTTNALDIKPIANSVYNISTMVNRTTGVKIREEGGIGSDFELSINGMSGNSIRYFIDGIPLSTKGSDINLSNIPVNIIDRIEIYKGVVPASLGADALGGAINIITKQNNKNYLDISYGIGSFNTHQFDLNAQYSDKKTGIIIRPTIGFNYSKNNYTMKDIELWDETTNKYINVNRKRFHDNYKSVLSQIEAGVINRTWTDAFFVSGSYSTIDKQLQTGNIQSIVYGKAKRESDAWNITARYSKRNFIVNKLNLNTSVSQTWDYSLTIDTAYRKYKWDGTYIESNRNEITGRGKSMRHYKRPLTIARANLDYALTNHHSLNLNYMLNRTGNKRYDDVDTDFEPSNDVLTKHILGLSYNQVFFDGRLYNTFFIKDYINRLRIEQHDISWITGSGSDIKKTTKNYIGYGAGSKYSFWEVFSIKASLEHSVRLPLARELLGNGTTVYANVNIKPENSNNYNLGAFGTIHFDSGHQLYYETNAFYRNVKDYIHLVISQAEGMSQYDNVANVDVKGIEGEIQYSYNNVFHLIANCHYQDARSKTKYYADGSPMITYNNKIPNRPWLFSNLELSYAKHNLFAKNSTFNVRYNFDYVHWFYLTWEGYGTLKSKSRIPAQYSQDITISQSFKKEKYNISVSCNNIFDRKIYDNYMLQKPGRTFFCKFRLFIN